MNYRRPKTAVRTLALGVVSAVLFLLPSLLAAQPAIEWQRTYGGTGNDVLGSMIETSDSNYLVVGMSESQDGDVHGTQGGGDFLVLKLRLDGSLRWTKSAGGTGFEGACSVAERDDSSYLVFGSTGSSDGQVVGQHGYTDVWITNLKPSGSRISEHCYGGSRQDGVGYYMAQWAYGAATDDDWGDGDGDDDDFGTNGGITKTYFGGYAFACSTNSADGQVTGWHVSKDSLTDGWIGRVANGGNLKWQRTLGGTGIDGFSSIVASSDGGFVAAGWTNSVDGDVTGVHNSPAHTLDVWVVKLTADGDIQWQKTFGGSNDDVATSVIQTADNGFAITGYTASHDGDVTGFHGENFTDVWVLKLDPNGLLEWEKAYGGFENDGGACIIQTKDGGYAVAGWTNSNDGDVAGLHGPPDSALDYWVLKLDAQGSIQWQETFGGTRWDAATSIIQTRDGGYLVGGSTLSSDGNVTGNHGLADFWLIKLESEAGAVGAPSDSRQLRLSLYPNPLLEDSRLRVNYGTATAGNSRFEICDELGRPIYVSEISNGRPRVGSIEVDCSKFATGTYICRLLSSRGSIVQSFTILR